MSECARGQLPDNFNPETDDVWANEDYIGEIPENAEKSIEQEEPSE